MDCYDRGILALQVVSKGWTQTKAPFGHVSASQGLKAAYVAPVPVPVLPAMAYPRIFRRRSWRARRNKYRLLEARTEASSSNQTAPMLGMLS